MDQKPNNLEMLFRNVHDRRVIVLLESSPQSNQFQQVHFTFEQFQKLSSCVQIIFTGGTNRTVVGVPIKHLPIFTIKEDGVDSYYSVIEK